MREPWLSEDDIACHYGVTKNTFHFWIADKIMPPQKIGRGLNSYRREVYEGAHRGGAAASAEAASI